MEAVFETESQEFKPGTVSVSYTTGPAGTGKTYQFKKRIEEDPDAGILCATTGVAAVNLGTTTLNSAFGYFDTDDLADKYVSGQLVRRYIHLRKHEGYLSVMIDETSMLDADAFGIHVQAASDANSRMAPDGMQISLELTGDFAQLPPVKGQWAFKSPEWAKVDRIAKLDKIYRQTDVAFLAALGEARRGNAGEAVSLLRPLAKWTSAIDLYFPGTTIVAKNDEVEKINRLRYLKLIGAERVYRSTRWGQQRSEWKGIPDGLGLREGALVMILSNGYEMSEMGMRGELIYANGDTGNVVEMLPTAARIQLKRNGQSVLVPLITRNFESKDEPDLKRWPEAYFNEARKRWISGGVTYLPVRLGYAITVHKSQGLTLDHVQLDPRAGFFGAKNMAYVALSRIKSPANLKIVGTPEMFQRRINVDPEVKEWL